MEPTQNLSQNSHRLRLRDHISSENDHYINIIVERIVFSIMVATVTLSLIFFLICKCFRRSNHSSDENPTEPKPSINRELHYISVLVYGQLTLPSSQPSCSETILEVENCAICLEDYVHGDRVRALPKCKHMFRKNCIEEWFQVQSLHCPVCGGGVLDHFLQSARSNNCRNQRIRIDNRFPLLTFHSVFHDRNPDQKAKIKWIPAVEDIADFI